MKDKKIKTNLPLMVLRLGLLLLLGCSLSACIVSQKNNTEQKNSPPPRITRIRLTPAEKQNLALRQESVTFKSVPISLKLKGQIEPDFGKEVDVSSRIMGQAVKICIHPGDNVKPGQVLAILDSHEIGSMEAELIEAKSKLAIAQAQKDREGQVYKEQFLRPKSLIEAKARFAEARAQLELADSEFHRQENLYQEKIASQRDFTTAKINREEARSDYEATRLNLQREEHLYHNQGLMKKDLQLAEAEYERALRHLDTLRQRLLFLGMTEENIKTVLDNNRISGTVQILAPVAGCITHVDLAIGEMVHNTHTIFRIVNLDHVIVKADLPETDLSLVSLGSPVEVVVTSYPKRIFEGTINFISETVNKENQSVPIRARLNNEEHLLKTNMSAQILLEGEEKNILACPKKAIFERNGKSFVYLVTIDGAELSPVMTGVEGIKYIEVLSGLSKNDQVYTTPNSLHRLFF